MTTGAVVKNEIDEEKELAQRKKVLEERAERALKIKQWEEEQRKIRAQRVLRGSGLEPEAPKKTKKA